MGAAITSDLNKSSLNGEFMLETIVWRSSGNKRDAFNYDRNNYASHCLDDVSGGGAGEATHKLHCFNLPYELLTYRSYSIVSPTSRTVLLAGSTFNELWSI